MPTGYTSDLYDGKRDITMREFVLTCARAFGACLDIRDDVLSSDIPAFVSSTYHKERFDETQINLHKYSTMSLEEADRQMEEEKEKNIAECLDYIDRKNKLEERYNNMIYQLRKWDAASDFIELKKFAIDQCTTAKEFDCSLTFSYEELKRLKSDTTTPEMWISNKLEKCIKDMKYYAEEQDKEYKRVERNNNWVKKLKESL